MGRSKTIVSSATFTPNVVEMNSVSLPQANTMYSCFGLDNVKFEGNPTAQLIATLITTLRNGLYAKKLSENAKLLSKQSVTSLFTTLETSINALSAVNKDWKQTYTKTTMTWNKTQVIKISPIVAEITPEQKSTFVKDMFGEKSALWLAIASNVSAIAELYDNVASNNGTQSLYLVYNSVQESYIGITASNDNDAMIALHQSATPTPTVTNA